MNAHIIMDVCQGAGFSLGLLKMAMADIMFARVVGVVAAANNHALTVIQPGVSPDFSSISATHL